ncbi:DUF1918 domain-containing protein [Microlunatus antarcticus]|uniref:DUF1918 domain-containing protein n=1 Tax=Microlunatus antarcticus TaxID=53388 RepID=A0A7W5JVS9_9ACTN|nr:DUF1918 domain-containing protein [Microlunatus antarcticus]MBB3327241.1 hypothetical protein [Microlunatus antarcticus]
MQAVPGDELVAASDDTSRTRNAEILEVRGADGQPPYRVRWRDTGLMALVTPVAGSVVLASGHDGENQL